MVLLCHLGKVDSNVLKNTLALRVWCPHCLRELELVTTRCNSQDLGFHVISSEYSHGLLSCSSDGLLGLPFCLWEYQTCRSPSFSLTNTTRFLSSFWCGGYSFHRLLFNASSKSALFASQSLGFIQSTKLKAWTHILSPSAVIELPYLRPVVATAGTTYPTGSMKIHCSRVWPQGPSYKNSGYWPRAPWCAASPLPPLNSLS